MRRHIIKIDEELCDGCGLCIPSCHEGALQIVDNKARLVSDVLCDGLGDCIGHCPQGAITIEVREASAFEDPAAAAAPATAVPEQASSLTHWPVQMHLINPAAAHFRGADLVLAADCVAFSLGSFHQKYLPGKTLAIACPKLDHGMEIYIRKIRSLISEAQINTLTVMKMVVPCCGGLLQLVNLAMQEAGRSVPVKVITVSTEGRIIQEDWVSEKF